MIKPAMIFGPHMTLQRNKKIAIWGKADTNRIIEVKLSDMKSGVKTKTDSKGDWSVLLPEHKAARDMALIITDGQDTVWIQDVRIGEVWIAGGQSNMEFYLKFDKEWNEVSQTVCPDITFFDYPEVSFEKQLEQMDYSKFGIWRTCFPENLPYYSAVAFYFAHKLYETQRIPIGIVGCNFGGTPACAWMDEKILTGTPGACWIEHYKKDLEQIDMATYEEDFLRNPVNDHTDPLKQSDDMTGRILSPGLSREEQKELLEQFSENMDSSALLTFLTGPWSEKRPGGLYETMLKKIVPYTARGIIFYQGESDEQYADTYEYMLAELIRQWRVLWKEELPFLMVQLAPFEEWMGSTGERYPILREAQEKVSKRLEQVYLCSSSDAGMQWDIHPKEKRKIGERLAMLARGHVYGEVIDCEPPEVSSVTCEANHIVVQFHHAEGLHLEGEQLEALKVCDPRGNILQPDEILIENGKLHLYGRWPQNIQIEFAWSPYYKVNLYNKWKNPAKPFRKEIVKMRK